MRMGQCRQLQQKRCARNNVVDRRARSEQRNHIYVYSPITTQKSRKKFLLILYLKSDCKALTAQPCALSQALVGNSDVDRRRDLLPLAPGVGVVNHLRQGQVKQESFVLPELGRNFSKTPFRRSQAGCLPCNLQGQHPECSLAIDRLPLYQGPRSGGLSESHFWSYTSCQNCQIFPSQKNSLSTPVARS